MKPRFFLAAALVFLACVPARATISFVVNADQLLNVGNIVIPDGAAVFIVAATSGGFSNPVAGNYTPGSSWTVGGNTDLVIYAVGSETESGEQGVVDSNPTLTLGNGWVAGDQLALYWFPSITYSALGTVLTNGTGFGTFNSSSTGDDAPDWVTPPNGSSDWNLLYLTPGGNLLGPGNDVGKFGTIGAVPEPSTFALIGGVLALGLVLRRRLAATV
jgi:hypothetical protein